MESTLTVKFIGTPSKHLYEVYELHSSIQKSRSSDSDILHISLKKPYKKRQLEAIRKALRTQKVVSFEHLYPHHFEQLKSDLLLVADKGGHTIFKRIHEKKLLSTTFDKVFEHKAHQTYFRSFLDHLCGIKTNRQTHVPKNTPPKKVSRRPILDELIATFQNIFDGVFPRPQLQLAGQAPDYKANRLEDFSKLDSHTDHNFDFPSLNIVPSVHVTTAVSDFWNLWTLDYSLERVSPIARIIGEDLFLYHNSLEYGSPENYPVRNTASQFLNDGRNGYEINHSGLACGLIDLVNGTCYDSTAEISGNNLVAGYHRQAEGSVGFIRDGIGNVSAMIGYFNHGTYAPLTSPRRSFQSSVSAFSNHTTIRSFSPRYVSAIVTTMRGYLVNTSALSSSSGREPLQSSNSLQQQFRITTSFIPRVSPVTIVNSSGSSVPTDPLLQLSTPPYQSVLFNNLSYTDWKERDTYAGNIEKVESCNMQMGFVSAGSVQVAMTGKQKDGSVVEIEARNLTSQTRTSLPSTINLASGGSPAQYSYPSDTNRATNVTTTEISDATQNIEFSSFTVGIDISATPYHQSSSRSDIVSQNISSSGPKYASVFTAGNVGNPPLLSRLPASGVHQNGARVVYMMDQYGTYANTFETNNSEVNFVSDPSIIRGIDMPLSTILSTSIGSSSALSDDTATLEITTYLDNGTITEVPQYQANNLLARKASPVVAVNKAFYRINTGLISVPPPSTIVTSLHIGQPTSRNVTVENLLRYQTPARLAEMTINFAEDTENAPVTLLFFVTDEAGNRVDAVDIRLFKQFYGEEHASITASQLSTSNQGVFPIHFTSNDTGSLATFEAFIEDNRGQKSATLYISTGSRSGSERLLVTAIATHLDPNNPAIQQERQSSTIAI